jgi:hypothetical protein
MAIRLNLEPDRVYSTTTAEIEPSVFLTWWVWPLAFNRLCHTIWETDAFIGSQVTLMKNKVTYTISQKAAFVVFVTVSTTHRLHIMDYVIAIGYPTARMKIAVGTQFVPDLTLWGVRTHYPSRFLKVGGTKSFALFVDATVCFLPFFLTCVIR